MLPLDKDLQKAKISIKKFSLESLFSLALYEYILSKIDDIFYFRNFLGVFF